MGSFQNPVGGAPRDPFEKPYRIEALEGDKFSGKEPPQPPDEPPSKEKLGIAAFVLQMVRKALDLFLKTSDTSKSMEIDASKNLLLLKASFEVLKKEDRSQDMQFLNQLSKIWRCTLENTLHFKNDAVAFKFKALIKKIQHYPENQLHTFGYYLAEYADQKWIPFPYMELVAKIHTEHEKNPTSSSLTEWTSLLDELVVLLTSPTP